MPETDAPGRLLERVRKLLAKAEAEGCTTEEAQALTAKAAELMAKYGIDAALLAADRPGTDVPADRMIAVHNPWNRVRAHLLCGLASAMRGQAIMITRRDGMTVHLFGYRSDLERVDLMYTSVLLQMFHGLYREAVPPQADSARAWRRSWLLGYCSAVLGRVRAAEEGAAAAADGERTAAGQSGALVLADRALVIRQNVAQAYPRVRQARLTYTGSGYGAGYAQGQRADLGSSRVATGGRRALSR